MPLALHFLSHAPRYERSVGDESLVTRGSEVGVAVRDERFVLHERFVLVTRGSCCRDLRVSNCI